MAYLLSLLKSVGVLPNGHMIIDNHRYRFMPLVIALAFVWAVLFVDQIYAKTGEIQGRRVALIVGNSNYKSVYSLKNAVSDSTSISAVLSRLGFEVIEVSDVTKAEFSKALKKFSIAAHDAEAAVFYYSGHGFQLGGSNFLVPVDAKLNSRKTILQETMRLNDVIEAVQDRNRQTLIFLDACRNNPLPKSVRDKSMLDGLAQLEAGTGTFVAFATQPGNITRDGAGDHSPFAAALIEHMETPGISISDMMIRVRNSVEVATLQTQTPWDQSSLRNQFYFSPEEEVNADLTDEDKQLLLSLPPALRKKFAAQFGIKFSDDGQVLTQTVEIKRRFQISAGGGGEAPDKPVAKKKQAIKGRFKIAAGGSDEPAKSEKAPVIVASLEPKKPERNIPELSPLDDELASNGASFIPLPNFRAGIKRFEPNKDQLVAALSPSDTQPEIAQRIAPVTATDSTSNTTALPVIAEKSVAVPKSTIQGKTVSATPNQVKSQPSESTPVISETSSATIVARRISTQQSISASNVSAKTKKPRVIAITNPELARSSNVGVEKDVQIALNSPARSIQTIKPSSGRSSLQPVTIKPKRLVGKEVLSKKEKDRKAEKNVQVAVLEPAKNASPEPNLVETSVAPIGLVSSEEKAGKDEKSVEVAALGNDQSTSNSRSDEDVEPIVEPSITPPSHAFEVQSELARLGCYRSKVDGLWGAKSARALFRYYGNKKVAPTELEPNASLLSLLRNDEVVVCKRTIHVIKKNKLKIGIGKPSSRISASRKKSKRIRVRKSVTIRKKALKKSLSKGVFR